MNPRSSSGQPVSDGTLEQRVLEGIRIALVRVDPRIAADQIDLDVSLVDDLGLDSLRFVDLTVAVEDALGIVELPIQEWHDAERARPGRGSHSVRSLMSVCMACLEGRRQFWEPR